MAMRKSNNVLCSREKRGVTLHAFKLEIPLAVCVILVINKIGDLLGQAAVKKGKEM